MIFFILIWTLCSLGFLGIADSMSKHQKNIHAKALTQGQSRLCALVGWLLLAVALFACIRVGAVSTMLSYYFGVLTFAALFVGLCLSYRPTQIKWIALILSTVCCISGLANVF